MPGLEAWTAEEIARAINAALDACRECADVERLTFLDVVRVPVDAQGCNWDVPALGGPMARSACGRSPLLRRKVAELRTRCRLA